MSERVVNLRYGENYDVYIGRAAPRRGLAASKWANPYKVGNGFTAWDACMAYEHHVTSHPELMAALPELRGKTLGCWCAPEEGLTADDPLICHGQILLTLLNELEKGECGD